MGVSEVAGVEQVEQLMRAISGFDVIDLAPLLHSNMPRAYPHPDMSIIDDARTIEQHGYRLQTLVLPEHVGAHCDAPSHVLPDRPGATVEHYQPTQLWGRAVTLDLSNHDWKAGEMLTLGQFHDAVKATGQRILENDVVLVNFGWSRHLAADGLGEQHWCFNTPGFTEEVCKALHESGVRVVGSDTHSCDIAVVNGSVEAAFGHFQYFLPNGIPIVETLVNLAQLPSVCYFTATPLRIHGGSGSPIRPLALVPRA